MSGSHSELPIQQHPLCTDCSKSDSIAPTNIPAYIIGLKMIAQRLNLLVGLLALLFTGTSLAQEDEAWQEFRTKFEASLKRQSGSIQLPGDIASLQLPQQFNYLSPQDTKRVLEEGWGNPPSELSLGMIIPAQYGVLDDAGWGVVIEYSNDGHISDDDAHAIDYAELLSELQADEEAENEQRRAAGYPATHLVGWAATPYYDETKHKLHWARELQFEGNEENTLNYNVRILGREGYLLLNAIGFMSQFDDINRDMGTVLEFTNFNSGYRYEDFNPEYDKVAAYGIGALVAGKLAAKAGLFAKLGILLLALKKYAVILLIGVAALFRKVYQSLRGRKTV